jgi:hypothetical protein
MLTLWTVYEKPKDCPHGYVVREWYVEAGEGEPTPGPLNVFNTLAEARAHVPDGRVRMPREETDDPCILETWL